MATRRQARQKLQSAREALAAAGMPVPAVEAMARYDWVARTLDGIVRRPNIHERTFSDRIDAVLTHKLAGTLIFVAVMALLFSSIFIWADPLMGLVDAAVGSVAELVEARDAGGGAAVAGGRRRDRRRRRRW